MLEPHKDGNVGLQRGKGNIQKLAVFQMVLDVTFSYLEKKIVQIMWNFFM